MAEPVSGRSIAKDTRGPKRFELSMLVYDTRYRSQTIQIFALICFLIFVFWIINNTATNLDALGKKISFNFLGEPAGYDINQRLVEYSSRDTHLRATFLGLLNTILVAFLGCVTATILGVFIGILRLSRNWVVSRLMAVYVETFRNVPVLLWILLMLAIIVESFPQPRAFRGANPEATMLVYDSVALTNRGFYIPEILFSNSLGKIALFGESSLRFNINLDFIAFVAILAAGLYAAGRVKRAALKKQAESGNLPTTWHIRLGIIFIPLAILALALGVHLGYPELKGFNFRGGIYLRNSLIALWLALSLYTAAFIAEIVRAGILAISSGQSEAARALGLRPGLIMSLVILPQALRVIIPPLISNYLNLTKNSSLAIAVGYLDLNSTLGGITINQTGRELEGFMLLLAIYLMISLSISAVLNWYNARKRLVER